MAQAAGITQTLVQAEKFGTMNLLTCLQRLNLMREELRGLMMLIRRKRSPYSIAYFVTIWLLFSAPDALLAQAIPGNVDAIASEPYGVARLYIPAGQLSASSSLRIVVSDPSDRIMFPAIDFLTSESPQLHSAESGGRLRLGNGAIIGRIRDAIQNAREQIDPPELVRVQFLFRGHESFQVRLSGDLEASIEVRPIKLSELIPPTDIAKLRSKKFSSAPQFQALIRSWWDGYVQ
ncbi:MAG TPA: hypothetical protein VM260_13935, partial [Pirellula sp.]|nr:hypothetical protein [Pirellula sp.]